MLKHLIALPESLFPLFSPDHGNILSWTNNEGANKPTYNYLLPVIRRDRPTFVLQSEILTKMLMLARSMKNIMILTHTMMLPEAFIQMQ